MRSDRFESRHECANTPHYVLKTALLLLFPAFTGVNFFAFCAFLLSFTGGIISEDDREILILGIIILALFVFVGILNVFDNRKGMKTPTVVIIWAVVYTGSAVLPFIPAFLPGLTVAVSEITVSALVLFILHKAKKL